MNTHNETPAPHARNEETDQPMEARVIETIEVLTLPKKELASKVIELESKLVADNERSLDASTQDTAIQK